MLRRGGTTAIDTSFSVGLWLLDDICPSSELARGVWTRSLLGTDVEVESAGLGVVSAGLGVESAGLGLESARLGVESAGVGVESAGEGGE